MGETHHSATVCVRKAEGFHPFYVLQAHPAGQAGKAKAGDAGCFCAQYRVAVLLPRRVPGEGDMPRIEFMLLIYAFLVNLVWEMLQMPLFAYPTAVTWGQASLECVQAAAGDALMLLASFWLVALLWRDRRWILQPSTGALGLFLVPGLAMTVVFEALATDVWGRWTYADTMPVLPVTGTGVVPLLQWVLLPLLIVWLVRRWPTGVK